MTDLHTMLKEDRRFPPPPEFARHAHIQGLDELTRLRADAARNPEAFWARLAEDLHWFRRWHTVLDWQPPFAKWFVGGQINISDNCLDRHLTTWRRNKAALIWEGEPGDSRVLTYQDLHREVCRFANVLKTTLGVKPGDRVAIYMPMVPEIAIAMLACARIGAVHSVIFGGFSADAVRDRVQDAEARIVLTADGGWRRGATVALKEQVDRALEQCPSVTQTVVLRRTGQPVAMTPGRDLWWHEAVAAITERDCPAEHLDSEHPLFILYTSGSTGKPKGVLHTTAGYLLHTSVTAKWVFDLKDDDCYWCTADAGWVTGHSYVVYGPLANGATVVMYEGAPNHPRPDRFWELIEKYRVTILYTAPTAIRAFMKWGDQWPNGHDLTSLRLLGSVGEPINPEAWMWYQRVIGGGRCPIVDTWWQTETGGILITPIPGATPTKPGSATLPFPGIDADVVTRDGTPVGPDAGGFLVIRRPWPGIMRTIYKDPERFQKQYFAEIPGCYFAGDGARRDADGYFWVMGRVDDVIKVAGHRLGTSEVESALVSHPKVAESAVVGRPDEIKGESIVAFVTLRSGEQATPELKEELRAHVSKAVGAIARPDEVRFSDALPKTRSGKIMRRLLRKIATGDQTLGDTSTLEDLSILAKLREDEE